MAGGGGAEESKGKSMIVGVQERLPAGQARPSAHQQHSSRMENSRLPSKACTMLYNIDCNGECIWASKVRQCLSLYAT